MIEDENTPGGIAKAIGLAMIFATVLILLVGCGAQNSDMIEKVWEDAKITCASHNGIAGAGYTSGVFNGVRTYYITAKCKNNVKLEYSVELK